MTSAFSKPAQGRKQEPTLPFASLFAAFPPERHSEVQKAIDALILAKRTVRLLTVQEHLAGVLPAIPREPIRLVVRVEPVVETVTVAYSQPEADIERQCIARASGACTPAKVVRHDYRARCERLAERARAIADAVFAYHRHMAAQTSWGYLPESNRYQGD